jgi:SNF2 family DNA or RNA helicase
MHIIKDKYVRVLNPSKDLLTNCKKTLTIANPAYGANKQMGISNFATPRNLQYYEYDITTDILKVPIGFWQESYHYLNAVDNRSDFESEIVKGLQFNGTLRPEQEKAVKTLASYSNGVLSAPTGSGKTVIALALMKQLGRKTLFIVDTVDLANQFISRCKTFLGYEPGLIGSGKFDVKDISVGILKTLTVLDEGKFKILNETFGCVIVDEVLDKCHIIMYI